MRGLRSALVVLVLLVGVSAPSEDAPLPTRLADTGLHAPGVRAYVPQYPLWSDGAAKRRWISLPRGRAIDAVDPDRWRFPVGTRLWKEFAVDGKPVETRLLERTARGWRFAAYAWNDAGDEARLVEAAGRPAARVAASGAVYDIPSRQDCLACHAGPEPVLGFNALQLSPDRDPRALHAEARPAGALDLEGLRREGLLHEGVGAVPAPRLPGAPRERAALGYLAGNCAACHRTDGPLADLGLAFDAQTGAAGVLPALATTLGVPARRTGAGALRLAPGNPDASALLVRIASAAPALRMPPLGTHVVDRDAVDLLSAWVREDLAASPPAPSPVSSSSPEPEKRP